MHYRLFYCLLIAVSLLISGCSPLSGKKQFFISDAIKIQYQEVGDGPPLFLLHGFAMTGELQWGGLVSDLAKHYRVIVPDHRGHGASDKPKGRERYGRHMVDDVVRLMDHLEIKEARVAGISMGGFMTVAVAAIYPERISCGFVGAAGWVDPMAEQMFDEEVALAFERGEGFDRLNHILNPENDPEDDGGWLGKLFFNWLIGDQDPMILASVYRGMSDVGISSYMIESSPVPLLTVIGDKDGLLPLAIALEETSLNHKLLVVKDKDHGSIGGAEEFETALQQFLADEAICGSTALAAVK
jgi:non-heme chloroperoxidase